MPTERENIASIQKALAEIKRAAKEEIARAKEGGDPKLINAWSKVFHSTGMHHANLTDLLFENFPAFAGEVVIMGPGGR